MNNCKFCGHEQIEHKNGYCTHQEEDIHFGEMMYCECQPNGVED